MSDQPEQAPESLEDIFGPPIFAYTRADAIADGLLVQIPIAESQRAGFALPMAVNHSVFHACEAKDEHKRRLMLAQCFDELRTLAQSGKSEHSDRIYFFLALPDFRRLRVVLHVGPGDTPDAVLTLCEPSEL